MRRREFISLIGGVAATSACWPPRAADAQQSAAVRRVGMLFGQTKDSTQAQSGLKAFNEALQKLGWVDGRNVNIEIRWAAADPERMQVLAKELVDLSPDVIFSTTTPATAALARATQKIPIIFTLVSDPVGSGFVAGRRSTRTNSWSQPAV